MAGMDRSSARHALPREDPSLRIAHGREAQSPRRHLGLRAGRVAGFESGGSHEPQCISIADLSGARARDDMEDPADRRLSGWVSIGPAEKPGVVAAGEVAGALEIERLVETLALRRCRQLRGTGRAKRIRRCEAGRSEIRLDRGERQWLGLGWVVALAAASEEPSASHDQEGVESPLESVEGARQRLQLIER